MTFFKLTIYYRYIIPLFYIHTPSSILSLSIFKWRIHNFQILNNNTTNKRTKRTYLILEIGLLNFDYPSYFIEIESSSRFSTRITLNVRGYNRNIVQLLHVDTTAIFLSLIFFHYYVIKQKIFPLFMTIYPSTILISFIFQENTIFKFNFFTFLETGPPSIFKSNIIKNKRWIK